MLQNITRKWQLKYINNINDITINGPIPTQWYCGNVIIFPVDSSSCTVPSTPTNDSFIGSRKGILTHKPPDNNNKQTNNNNNNVTNSAYWILTLLHSTQTVVIENT